MFSFGEVTANTQTIAGSEGQVTNLPRITILMPCRNGKRYIVEAIESLRRQAYPNLEHIVLDACSTDGTLRLLARYPDITLVSEPDEGAHEAMNKGIERASGDVLGFIAVDDLYPDGTLVEVGRVFAARPEVEVVVGHSLAFEDDDLGHRKWLSVHTHPNDNGLWLPELMFGVPGFFGCFFRRRVFDRVGRFDGSYFYAADRHFLLRVALNTCHAARIDRPTICYRVHPDSQTMNPQRANLVPMSLEHVRMGQELAAAASADVRARRIFLAWHAFECVKLILRTLLGGHFGNAAHISFQLCWHDPLWPLRFMHGLMLRHAVRLLNR